MQTRPRRWSELMQVRWRTCGCASAWQSPRWSTEKLPRVARGAGVTRGVGVTRPLPSLLHTFSLPPAPTLSLSSAPLQLGGSSIFAPHEPNQCHHHVCLRSRRPLRGGAAHTLWYRRQRCHSWPQACRLCPQAAMRASRLCSWAVMQAYSSQQLPVVTWHAKHGRSAVMPRPWLPWLPWRCLMRECSWRQCGRRLRWRSRACRSYAWPRWHLIAREPVR
mmetsp:Transcript_14233/g.36925  ORF Transcript_14233/g.36925 Transcript_14233/m.36925 type:complete len:219 (+) Transcript_14233:1037-1693(+)